MPYPPQVFSLAGHAFGLTVSGVQVIKWVPTDLSPLRWEMPSEATTGGLSFTILDTGQLALPAGSVVRLTDNVTNSLLFSGVLVNRRYARHVGPVRRVECQAAGWGWFLDHRIVTSFTWAGEAVHVGMSIIGRLIREFGGPVTPVGIDDEASFSVEAGVAARTTLRAAIGSVAAAHDDQGNPFTIYVNDNAEARYWWSFGGEAALGTTTYSIGDQGDFIPEDLTYEVGSDDRANIVAAYDDVPTFLRWAWVGGWSSTYAVSPWDAGDPSTYHVDTTGVDNPEVAAMSAAWMLHGDITSVSFSTTEYGGWKPHQAIVIDDSLLTGGVAETHYIASVSGQIDDRDCIEWRVTTGAVARSLVQTVAAP